jgi:hypothetical protein
MSDKKVLVLGGNFAGLTAALSLKYELRDGVDVTVVAKSDRFQFNPSFIWIPFGKRKVKDVVFPVAKTFTSHGVQFVHGEATKIDPAAQQVHTSQGVLGFDYLVIATGYLNDFDVVPGLGPGGHAYSITSLEGAVDAAEGWARLVNDPGPVVVAATQGAACFGAAYEFVFNAAYHLRKQKLKVPVAYVSAEPFPGHFGIGGLPGGEKLLGMFFKHQGIQGIFDVAMEEVVPGEIRLADGRKLPFKYAMVVPPFVGAEVVNASGLGNAKGFIEVKDTYQRHCCIERSPRPMPSTRAPRRSGSWARSSGSSTSLAPSTRESLHFARLRRCIPAQCNSAARPRRQVSRGGRRQPCPDRPLQEQRPEGVLLALLPGLLVAGKLRRDELEPLKRRVAPGLLAGFHPRGG